VGFLFLVRMKKLDAQVRLSILKELGSDATSRRKQRKDRRE
jgi:hypothetical protein